MLSAIKRLWPTIFAEEVEWAIGGQISRLVVSTHTMALAHQLYKWLEKGGQNMPGLDLDKAEPVALPRKLVRRHKGNPTLADAKRIPDLLEAAQDAEDEAAYEKVQHQIKQTFGTVLGKEESKLEIYYALLMMDSDRMGAILSGDERTGTAITYRESFHP